MASKVFSCTINSFNAELVEVQAAITNGLPYFSIIGMADKLIQESKERVRLSIKNSGLKFPAQRKTVNLSPITLHKSGAYLDLSIALSLLIESKQVNNNNLDDTLFIGELGLSGEIKPINGALLIAQTIKNKGFKKLFIADQNAKEASLINELEVYPLKHIKEMINHLNKKNFLKPVNKISLTREFKQIDLKKTIYLSQIKGLEKEKRALSITAAGGHNLLLKGPPGTGKTMLARSINEILPQMTKKEVIETSKIFSISGYTNYKTPLIFKRPFREINQTKTLLNILGGGKQNKIGEVNLAHNGVLFFDEISEFNKNILEAMRQPIENKWISNGTINDQSRYPSNFIFIATMNPCRCGYFNSKHTKCICTKTQVDNYKRKISGAILDRFDIFLDLEEIKFQDFRKDYDINIYNNMFKKINIAYEIQNKRFKNNKSLNKNSEMQLKDIEQYCTLDKDSVNLLSQAKKNLNLSNRAYINTIKVSQTIADLENSRTINKNHLAEAIQYRIK